MSMVGIEAKPLSVETIRDFAGEVRLFLGVKEGHVVDVENLIDLVLPVRLPGFHYWLGDEGEMGDNHGQAIPARLEMCIRTDVHAGVIKGKPRDRETVMHEIGHLLLHKPDQIRLNRNPGTRIRQECDPEWQADTFAAEFLAHHSIAALCRTGVEFAKAAGVPITVGLQQWKSYKEAGLI